MKKALLTLILSTFTLLVSAQSEAFQNLKRVISINHPEINLENKLIAYNLWSTENEESRELNKSFEKNYIIYKNAKLKGGSKGLVVISINKDNLSSSAVISLTKDGIKEMISVKLEEVTGIDPQINNVLFDADGNQVYVNIKPQNVFTSINQLITR